MALRNHKTLCAFCAFSRPFNGVQSCGLLNKSRLDVHEVAIVDVLQRIMKILEPPPPPEAPVPEIGFHVKADTVPLILVQSARSHFRGAHALSRAEGRASRPASIARVHLDALALELLAEQMSNSYVERYEND